MEKSIKNIAASVHHRLLSKARESSRPSFVNDQAKKIQWQGFN
jgi:hypothetical protein